MIKMLISRAAGAAALMMLAISPAFAQDDEAFADWIAGEWTGPGQFSGQDSMAILAVNEALGGRFYAFRYRFATAESSDGESLRFEGLGLYRAHGEDAWTGHWFDSMDNVHPLNGAIDSEGLVAHWGENGRTHYRRVGDNRLEIVDAVRNASNEWQEFARYSLNRVAPGGATD